MKKVVKYISINPYISDMTQTYIGMTASSRIFKDKRAISSLEGEVISAKTSNHSREVNCKG